jgi:hypothetical protein
MSFRPRRLAPLLAVALAVTAYGASAAPESTPAGYVAGSQSYVEFQPATGLVTIQHLGGQNSTGPGATASPTGTRSATTPRVWSVPLVSYQWTWRQTGGPEGCGPASPAGYRR